MEQAHIIGIDLAKQIFQLHGRQGAAGQDIEDGPARRQAAADHRRDDGGELGGPARRAAGFMAGPDAGAQAANAGCGGVGQQDGAHRLGADDEERCLQGAGAGRLRGRPADNAGRNVSRSEDG